jgi:ADP-dependent phosphofructokinase/glucokinase
VDAIFPVDTTGLLRLGTAVASPHPIARAVAEALLSRVASGRGGELLFRWNDGAEWVRQLLGEPARTQIGGTGPQASWALAEIGAPSVLALRDRSAQQLAVVDPHGEPTKQPHCILEFTAGTPFVDTSVPRSTRIILRFGDEPIEQDENYFDLTPHLHGVQAALISGMNSLRPDDVQAKSWLTELSTRWREAGVGVVHHEMAEYATLRHMDEAIDARIGTSIGLSLAELRTLAGSTSDPAHLAAALGERSAATRVIVHADQWSLAVYKAADAPPRRQLLIGNLLAAARAQSGQPVADLFVDAEAALTDDLPPSGPVTDGWAAISAPSLYLSRPATTIGLGDTFVAGVLLGDSLPTV